MRRFEITRELYGEPITALVLCFESGVHVSLFGGQLPHIGAVSVANPSGEVETTEFPTHKEGVVSDRWAKALAEAGYVPDVVEAGIHYDNLSKEGIMEVLNLTEQMLSEVLTELDTRR